MGRIASSWFVNKDAHDIAFNNCLSEHSYLIKYYWQPNIRNNIMYSLYYEEKKISEKSIVKSLRPKAEEVAAVAAGLKNNNLI